MEHFQPTENRAMDWILKLKVITLLGYIAALAALLISSSDGALSQVLILRLATPL